LLPEQPLQAAACIATVEHSADWHAAVNCGNDLTETGAAETTTQLDEFNAVGEELACCLRPIGNAAHRDTRHGADDIDARLLGSIVEQVDESPFHRVLRRRALVTA